MTQPSELHTLAVKVGEISGQTLVVALLAALFWLRWDDVRRIR